MHNAAIDVGVDVGKAGMTSAKCPEKRTLLWDNCGISNGRMHNAAADVGVIFGKAGMTSAKCLEKRTLL